jgi:uncharacterized protein DUF2505
MEVNLYHHFEHNADELFKHFFDIDKIEEKNRSLGNKKLEVERCATQGNTGEIRISREIPPSGDIPSALKAFHNEKNRVTQTEYWTVKGDGTYLCEFDVEIEGVPAKLNGKMHLVPKGEHAVNNVSLNIKCKVPFLGKIITGFLAKDARLQMDAEYEIIKQQLIAD